MTHPALDKFGKILMTQVRDEALDDWKMMLQGKMKGETAEAVRKAISKVDDKGVQVFVSLLPEVVDTVRHHLLLTIEHNEDIRLDLVRDGEIAEELRALSDGLPGELYGKRGWIARFSKSKELT